MNTQPFRAARGRPPATRRRQMVGRITPIVLPDKDGVKREPNILEKSDLLAWLQVRATTGRGGGPTQSPPHPGRVVAAALRCRAAAVPQDLFQDNLLLQRVARGRNLLFCPWQPYFPIARGPNWLYCPWQPLFSIAGSGKQPFCSWKVAQKLWGRGLGNIGVSLRPLKTAKALPKSPFWPGGKQPDSAGGQRRAFPVSQKPILAGWETTG